MTRLLRSTFTTLALLAGLGLTTQAFARDHDKLEKIEKIADKIEKVEKANKPDRPEKPERPDR
jgi:hypothetical protein